MRFLASETDHVLGNIDGANAIEAARKIAGNPARPAADFKATLGADAVLPPLLEEVTPVRLPESVELLLGPGRGAIFSLVAPRSRRPKRIAPPPPLPFQVRLHSVELRCAAFRRPARAM